PSRTPLSWTCPWRPPWARQDKGARLPGGARGITRGPRFTSPKSPEEVRTMATTFDLATQLRAAFGWRVGARRGRAGGGRWVSATGLEQRVRAAAYEVAENLPYGTCGHDVSGMGGVRVRGLDGLSLLAVCRRFLFDLVKSGQLRAYRPAGEGTRAGTRFRPAGGPPSAPGPPRPAAARARAPL